VYERAAIGRGFPVYVEFIDGGILFLASNATQSAQIKSLKSAAGNFCLTKVIIDRIALVGFIYTFSKVANHRD
jgi:hypothetical protein